MIGCLVIVFDATVNLAAGNPLLCPVVNSDLGLVCLIILVDATVNLAARNTLLCPVVNSDLGLVCLIILFDATVNLAVSNTLLWPVVNSDLGLVCLIILFDATVNLAASNTLSCPVFTNGYWSCDNLGAKYSGDKVNKESTYALKLRALDLNLLRGRSVCCVCKPADVSLQPYKCYCTSTATPTSDTSRWDMLSCTNCFNE
jgi:hypothetical protein